MTRKNTSLWAELSRRNVFRVAIGYLGLMWLLIQVADIVLSNFAAPAWIVQAIIAATALGFPFILLLAWFYEVTPEGVRAESELAPEHTARYSRRKIDLAIIGTLVLAVAFLIARDFMVDRHDVSREASIAVLPFLDLSPEGGQEYFSDGIAEELINVLAKIPEVRVISRSSSFSFRDADVGAPAIADQLNVDHILEGSVRYFDDQVRIGVQLIDARADAQLWSATYDRSMDSIFVVQREIAAGILEQLRVTLLGDVPSVAEALPEAYALYLRALHIMNERIHDSYPTAIAAVQEALVMDPDYVPAIVLLGRLRHSEGVNGLRPLEEGVRLAREQILRALDLDANYGPAVAWLGYLARNYDDDLVASTHYAERALALEPRNADMIGSMASMVATLSSIEEGIVMSEYAATHDPMCDTCYYIMAQNYRDAGRFEDAEAAILTARALRPNRPAHDLLGQVHLLRGDPERALAEFGKIEDNDHERQYGTAMALHDLGRVEEYESILANLIASDLEPLALAELYAYVGDLDAAFSALDERLDDEAIRRPVSISRDRMFAKLHDDPRWEDVLRRLGTHPEQIEALDFNVTLPN